MRREQLLQCLARWRDRGWIRALDVAFAHFLAELDADADAMLLLAAALVSHQLGRGHICLCLTEALAEANANLTLPPEALMTDGHEDLPSRLLAGQGVATWIATLQASPLVGEGNTPLVLVDDRLYLRRYRQYELDVAAGILSRAARDGDVPADLPERLAELFGTGAGPDWQKIACALAVRKRFAVITGGPGTGKTTTVVKLLALLQGWALQQGCGLRIRLAAPTGKAAARLTDSIGRSLAQLPAALRADIPAEAGTLHKLLGARPGSRHFRHDETNPLHADVVIVDEASMIDLEMMASLLKALRPDTRLVLLGDKDQLASVEAGSVLGDLCRHADSAGYNDETVAWLRWACGEALAACRGECGLLDQQIAMLRVSHRFDERSGIGQLAWAVNAGDPVRVAAVWQCQPGFADIRRLSVAGAEALFVDGWGEADQAATGYRHYLQVLGEGRPAADSEPQSFDDWADAVLTAFDRFQLLCALRQGEWGVEALNVRIAELLLREGLIAQTHGWYEGRPVLVTRNDYALGLMNGDIGIALKWPDAAGDERLRVAFRQADGRIRLVLPSRLSDVESVYAMTVHKSQGSEFDHVALLLPDRASQVLTRELIYTGITRAKRRFTLLAGDEGVLEQAVLRRVSRAGGLGLALDAKAG